MSYSGKFLGKGAYGTVIAQSEETALKFSNMENGITPTGAATEMAWEFCLAITTNSPFIAKVKGTSNKFYVN